METHGQARGSRGPRRGRRPLLAAALLTTASLAGQELTFSIGEWPPYTGASLEGGGMAAELVAAACQAAGLRARFEFVPWRRAEAYVQAGDRFGTFPYVELPERRDRFRFSGPLFTSHFAVLRNTGTASADPAAFRGARVGITAGTDAVRLPLEAAGARVEETPSIAPSLRKLNAGRLDYVIDDRTVLFDALKEMRATTPMPSLQFLEAPFGAPQAFRIMVSRKYPGGEDLLRRLEEGLGRIRASGVHRRILTRYGLTR